MHVFSYIGDGRWMHDEWPDSFTLEQAYGVFCDRFSVHDVAGYGKHAEHLVLIGRDKAALEAECDRLNETYFRRRDLEQSSC
jgi:hypothetical protein